MILLMCPVGGWLEAGVVHGTEPRASLSPASLGLLTRQGSKRASGSADAWPWKWHTMTSVVFCWLQQITVLVCMLTAWQLLFSRLIPNAVVSIGNWESTHIGKKIFSSNRSRLSWSHWEDYKNNAQVEEKASSNVSSTAVSNNSATESTWLDGVRGGNLKPSLLNNAVLLQGKKKKSIVYAIPWWICSILDVLIKKIFQTVSTRL